MVSQSSGEDAEPKGMGLEWLALILGFLGVGMTLFRPVMHGEFMSDDLNTALSGIRGSTPGTVTGTGLIGDFTAGNMEMGAKNDDGPIQSHHVACHD